jgi:hypothetical protein
LSFIALLAFGGDRVAVDVNLSEDTHNTRLQLRGARRVAVDDGEFAQRNSAPKETGCFLEVRQRMMWPRGQVQTVAAEVARFPVGAFDGFADGVCEPAPRFQGIVDCFVDDDFTVDDFRTVVVGPDFDFGSVEVGDVDYDTAVDGYALGVEVYGDIL